MRLFLAIPSEKTNKKNNNCGTLYLGRWQQQMLRNILGHAPSPWSVSNGADALIFLLAFFFPTQELKVQMQKLLDVHDFKKNILDDLFFGLFV